MENGQKTKYGRPKQFGTRILLIPSGNADLSRFFFVSLWLKQWKIDEVKCEMENVICD